MSTNPPEWAEVAQALAALRETMAGLETRLAKLELATAGSALAEGQARAVASRDETAELQDEIVAVLGAALAAYFGKRPHIRSIRLLGTDAWALQGRASIQASHALSVQKG